MKFIHLGDLHLGKSLGEFDLIEDQKFILNQILDLARAHQVDAMIIAGDVYDRSIPSEAAVNLLDFFIGELAEAGIATFMISGNHDSDDRLNFGSSLFQKNQIYIDSKYQGELKCEILEDEFGEVCVYRMPFIKASQVKSFFPEEDITTYEDAVRFVLEHTKIDPSKRNLLVAHQFVVGKGEDPKLAGSESVGTKSVGTVEKIGSNVFDDFDYVALGHIHSPQKVGRETIRYAGSPLKYSLSEVHNNKTIPLIHLKDKGEVEVTLLALKPMRDLRHIKGPMKQLLDKNHVQSTDDFIYVTLTDEDVINDAMGIFQQVYQNTVKIDYDNSRTKEMEALNLELLTESKSFDELVGDFYKFVYGCEIEEEEAEIMKKIAEEVGVYDETN